MRGGTPEKFGRYMEQLLRIAQAHGQEYAFVTAWNEWGEGAYLEPDTWHGSAWLEALQQAVMRVNQE